MIDRFDDDDDDIETGDGEFEPTPEGLAKWLEAQFHGDERFDEIETAEPGPLDGETVRVKLIVDDNSHFFASVFEDDRCVRVGLCTKDRAVGKAIEGEADDSGQSLTEIMKDMMEADEDLEYEVQHFKEGAHYFCSDIPYANESLLADDDYHDLLAYYLDGYFMAYMDKLAEE